MKLRILTLVLLLCLFLLVVQSSHVRAASMLNKQVEAQGDVYLRDGYPAGLFYKKGEVVDTIQKGEKVVVEDWKEIRTLFGVYEWLKIRRTSPKAATGKESGWVYNGKINGQPYFLIAVEKEKPDDV